MDLRSQRGPLRDGRTKHWFWCDNAIFEIGLSKHAILAYLFLCRKAGDTESCWPSIQTIARATGCSRNTTKQALEELYSAGLVESKQRLDDDGAVTSNIYVLFNPGGARPPVDLPRPPVGVGARPPVDLPRPPVGVGARPPVDLPRPPVGQEEEESTALDLETKKSTALTPVTDPHFEAFYQAYPRKVKRQEARQAWLKLALDEALVRTIMAAVETQKQTPGSALAPTNGLQFIPYPASWLNGRRWEDADSGSLPALVRKPFESHPRTQGNIETTKQGMSAFIRRTQEGLGA